MAEVGEYIEGDGWHNDDDDHVMCHGHVMKRGGPCHRDGGVSTHVCPSFRTLLARWFSLSGTHLVK